MATTPRRFSGWPVTRDAVTGEIFTYHQADSRRRDFAGLARFPAGLLSVGDAARLDALTGAQVPQDISRQRWTLDQLIQASPADQVVARAVNDVTFMLAHPDTLADPALLNRAIAANQVKA